jgi:hypothetical protein
LFGFIEKFFACLLPAQNTVIFRRIISALAQSRLLNAINCGHQIWSSRMSAFDLTGSRVVQLAATHNNFLECGSVFELGERLVKRRAFVAFLGGAAAGTQ